MNTNTFGSDKVYKMLPFLTEKIDLLEDNKKAYISSFIQDFNLVMKNFDELVWGEIWFKNYLLELMSKDYVVKVENFEHKYDSKIISYLKNYINARIGNSRP